MNCGKSTSGLGVQSYRADHIAIQGLHLFERHNSLQISQDKKMSNGWGNPLEKFTEE